MNLSGISVVVLAVISIVITSGCCSCTEKFCVEENSGPFTIKLDESLGLSEIDSLKIQEYDSDFNYIGELLNTNDNTERELSLIPSTLNGSVETLSRSIVLLRIASISQIDTITNLNFTKKEESLKCNDCSGMGNCEDENYINKTFTQVSHGLNGQLINNREIKISRK